MHRNFDIDPKRIVGKRENLSAQNTVADEIVSAFSDPNREPPLEPLSPLPAGQKKATGQALAIIATVLVAIPFIYPLVLVLQNLMKGYSISLLVYPFLVLGFRAFSFLGGFLLFLAARKATVFQRVIGWIALANVLFPIVSIFFIGGYEGMADPSTISMSNQIVITVLYGVSLITMIALLVFAFLLLVRIFRKKKAQTNA